MWYCHRGFEIDFKFYFYLLLGTFILCSQTSVFRMYKYSNRGWKIISSTPFILHSQHLEYQNSKGKLKIEKIKKDYKPNFSIYPKSDNNQHQNLKILSKYGKIPFEHISRNGLKLLNKIYPFDNWNTGYLDIQEKNKQYHLGNIFDTNLLLFNFLPNDVKLKFIRKKDEDGKIYQAPGICFIITGNLDLNNKSPRIKIINNKEKFRKFLSSLNDYIISLAPCLKNYQCSYIKEDYIKIKSNKKELNYLKKNFKNKQNISAEIFLDSLFIYESYYKLYSTIFILKNIYINY